MTGDRLRSVLFVGHTGFVKAPVVVAEVFSRLAEECDELAFTWCSPASQHEEIRRRLSPRARERTSMRGWMSQTQLRQLYDGSGIFLFPSFYEGFGKVFLEAMARGMCVVTSDTGGMRDLISHGVDGFKVSVGDVDGFVSTVRQLLQRSERSRAVSHCAAETARRYSWDRVARETIDFYMQLLNSRGLRRR